MTGTTNESPAVALRPQQAGARRSLVATVAAIALLLMLCAFAVAWGLAAGETASMIAVSAGVTGLLSGAAIGLGLYARAAHHASEQTHLRQLQQLADYDVLSGLHNYRYLRREMERVFVAARAGGHSCAFILLDLNDFKDANDRFGQEAGDAIIAAIGAALRDAVGDQGLVARYGGDEFAVLLPDGDADAAAKVAQTAADAVKHASLNALPQNQHLHTSASYGVAVFPHDAAGVEGLIAHADRMLYQAKAERSTLESRTQERHAQDVFFAIGEAIGRSMDPQELLHNLVRAVGTSLGIESCALWLLGKDTDSVRIRAYYVVEDSVAEHARVRLRAEPFHRREAEALGLLSRAVYADDVGAGVVPERFGSLFPEGSWGISVPLVASQRGVLMMVARHDVCAPPSMSLVEAVGRLASTAINNADAYASAKSQGEHLAALAGVGGLLFGDGSYEERLATVVERAGQVIGCDTLTIDTSDPTQERPFIRQFWGRGPDGAPLDERIREAWLSIRPALKEPSVVRFLESAVNPIVMDDPVNQVPEIYREVIIDSGVQTAVVMPIIWQGETKGLFYFASYRKDAFSEQDMALMQTIAAQLAPSIQVATLHVALEHSYAELKDAHREAILRLAYAAEARDPYTGRHLQRIGQLSQEIARRVGFNEDEVEAIGYAAIVHDLGKLRIPDAILIKPGELSAEDWVMMKKHPEYGADLLGAGGFYNLAREVALHHHERWDGSGYPFGLVGDAIPRAARIVMVADIYDALISARPYKPAWPATRALQELMIMRGRKLCPESVDMFLQMWEDGTVARIEAATIDASFESDFRERWAA